MTPPTEVGSVRQPRGSVVHSLSLQAQSADHSGSERSVGPRVVLVSEGWVLLIPAGLRFLLCAQGPQYRKYGGSVEDMSRPGPLR